MSSSSNSNQPNANNGIGIVNFLKHKNYFITGCTGFIGKVFIEKLLREVPEVHKVHTLMRAKNAEAAMQRLKTEIIDCEVFKRLKNEHGERYEEFMKRKLVAVVGNVSDPCLGMDSNLASFIADQIDVIINTAGNTKWHERYDVLLDVNVIGLSRLLGYALDCKKLCLFLHISTAYCTRETSEVILEKPISMEESIAEGQDTNCDLQKILDIEAELKKVTEIASRIPNDKLPIEMAKLGLRRAKVHGFYNTYVLTKAMGETLITKLREKLQIVIIRPTLIESSFRDPFPGWIEGYKVMDPMILSYGKGQLQRIYADPTIALDVVPVDMVVNAMIAAIANHGITREHALSVYQVASSMVNPLLCQKLFEFCYKFFKLHPIKTSSGEVIRVKEMEYFASMDEYILLGLPLNDTLHRMLLRMAAIYEPIMFCSARFNNKNTQDLFEKMSLEEQKRFNFNVKSIDWEDYFMRIHFFGLRRYILKEKFILPKL